MPLDTPEDFLEILEVEIQDSPESVLTLDEVPDAVEAAKCLREALGLAPKTLESRWG